MTSDFRTAVFHLCKKCANNPKALEIRKLLHEISSSNGVSESNSQTMSKPLHGDLAYISSHNRIQFLGYLLTDESVESINNSPFFHVTPLNENERSLIETAHLSIDFFIRSCIEEIKLKYPTASILINPYINYKEPKISTASSSFLLDKDIEECVEAFKSSQVYKKIIENDTLCILQQAPGDTLKALNTLLDKQLMGDYSTIGNETKQMIDLIASGHVSMKELLIVYTVYCYALQKSLGNAVQMLFEAIIGEELIVLDNDSIINVYNERSDVVYERYTVLSQDVFDKHGFSSVGSVILLNCDISEGRHIKEFGKVFSETLSFNQEFGPTTKVSFVTVDKDLNPIHSLTDYIIRSKIGQIQVVSASNLPQSNQ